MGLVAAGASMESSESIHSVDLIDSFDSIVSGIRTPARYPRRQRRRTASGPPTASKPTVEGSGRST